MLFVRFLLSVRIVVPVLVQRDHAARETLGLEPFVLTARAQATGPERIPRGPAPRKAGPAIVRAGPPLAFGTVDLGLALQLGA